jgi:hypothetical protein
VVVEAEEFFSRKKTTSSVSTRAREEDKVLSTVWWWGPRQGGGTLDRTLFGIQNKKGRQEKGMFIWNIKHKRKARKEIR